jgi:hypothetical protein
MDPRKEAPEVLEKTVQEFGQKALGAEDGAEVRNLAYAKDTPLHGPINGLLGRRHRAVGPIALRVWTKESHSDHNEKRYTNERKR